MDSCGWSGQTGHLFMNSDSRTVALYRPVSACFRLPFCSPQSVLQFVLADAFVVLFQFQVAFLQHINICDLNIPPQQPAKPEQHGIGES
jgi:hypothetical protein